MLRNDYNKVILDKIEKRTREYEGIREMLLEAIAERGFKMAYQEKVDARTGVVIGLEALARWETKEQCDLLLALGCYRIQGYYYSKPTLIRDMI